MERTWREKIEGTTDQILAQIKRLLDEGNIRRVVVKQQGRVVAEFPLTVGPARGRAPGCVAPISRHGTRITKSRDADHADLCIGVLLARYGENLVHWGDLKLLVGPTRFT